MPAFGEHHDDATLWNIAALVSELPGMTAETYERYDAGGPDGRDHGH